MGLAIAKGIVEAHSGRIWIEAGHDEGGARVAFTVPVGDDTESNLGLATKDPS
jgi:signal transduction histidine kinase